jgi:uncharacterized protein (DUF433 family)/uncharacterized protein YuzE
MKISYDRAADTLTFVLGESPSNTREMGEGIPAAYGAREQLVGIQISEALKRLGNSSVPRHVVLEGLGPPVAQGQPPSTIVASHIVLDEKGVAWIDDSNIKVIEVVMDRVAWDWSPEAIHRQHPALSLAQIHAALSYYYDHQAELDAEIQQDQKEADDMRSAVGNDTAL